MAGNPSRKAETLPTELTSFVGRRPEITEVKQLLGQSRLVTVTGLGGVGKTRLSLRVARDVRRVFADGVFLVELAALQDPALLPHTVVDALGIAETSTKPPLSILTDFLEHRQTLLVLDNCEHLLEAVSYLVSRLLRAAPQLRVLATSRQALMVEGEHVFPLSTLPVPDPEVPLAAGLATQYPALALFSDRAAAVVPGFKVDAANQDDVIRLCYRLDGIPLAIELAAVRLRVLSVAELADRLDDRFQVLTQSSRDAPERHQTLLATIDYSHSLCAPEEQTLWARASVFTGGFALEALEAVCADDVLPRASMLDTVSSLAEKSIFGREEHDGQIRFRMLETIREYGADRLLDSGEEPELRRRHREWYLHLVEQASAEWFGPQQESWATRLQLEHANLRSALESFLGEADQARSALRMAGLPWYLWLACGFMTEGRLWLDRALALDPEPGRDRAWALGTAGHIAVLQGDEAGGTAYLEESLRLGEELDDVDVRAYATQLLGLRGFLSVDLQGAVALFEHAVELYRGASVPDDYYVGMLVQFATALLLMDEVDRAHDMLVEMHDRCQEAGESWLLSYAIWGLAFVKLIRGQVGEAEAGLREALRIKRRFHDTLGLAFSLDVLAWTKIAKGQAEHGARLLGGGSRLWQTVGAQLFGSKDLMVRREQFEDLARAAIGDSAFDASFAQGGELPLEELLDDALEERQAPPAGRERRAQASTGLTRRELEVADLVADGLSNKEIAASLVISLRTAEAHVEHILSKLGFSSRSQVAAWVTEQRAAT